MTNELTRLIDECVFEGGMQSQYDDVQKYVVGLLADKDAEIAALKARLEIMPGCLYDGIDARGLTIKHMDKELDDKIAEIAELRKDAERLDWLDQNIFSRENLDFKGDLHPTMHMWVTFAPKGHQGSARNILDAAIAQAVQAS